MELRADGSCLVPALSMSRLPHEEVSQEAAEIAGLVRLTLGGDAAAFEQIILRYETRVTTLAARLLGGRDEACDAAQEVFLRAFKYLHRLDRRDGIITSGRFARDREEIERRLAFDLAGDGGAARKDAPAAGTSLLAYALAAAVSLIAVLLYLALGTPASLLQAPG